jgi:hypothetical protein
MLLDFRLVLRFDNGVCCLVNLADELDGEVFGALRDPALFATARHHPVMRTAAWGNGADLAPAFLCELMQTQQCALGEAGLSQSV